MEVREAGAAGVRSGAPRIASIGGGTGQAVLIKALRLMGAHIDVVVAMADDGNSTGLLRERAGVLPPGDIRSCLIALAADPDAPLARMFGHRFPYIENHALGNLVLTALAEEGLDFPEAVRICEGLLGCVGHVHPSTCDDIHLAGRAADGRTVFGQAALSRGVGRLEEVWLEAAPGAGRAAAADKGEDEAGGVRAPMCADGTVTEPAHIAADKGAVRAIAEADAIVIGPGSLFTSLLSCLLVPGILDAVRSAACPRILVLPKAFGASESETAGMDAEACLDAFERHVGKGVVDTLLVHRSADPFDTGSVSDTALMRLRARVPRVIIRDFTDSCCTVAHDARILADALGEALAGADVFKAARADAPTPVPGKPFER